MLVSLATLLAVAGLSSAQAGWSCNSLVQPNWEECDSIASTIPWSDGPGAPTEVQDGKCAVFLDKTKNCLIHLCSNRGNGQPTPMNAFMSGDYFLIKNSCSPVNAGGETTPFDGTQIVRVTNNPDVETPSRIKRAISGKVTTWTTTLEESDKIYEEAVKKTRAKRMESRSAQVNQNEKRQDKWTTVAIYDNIRKPGERTRMSAIAGSGSSQSWSTTEGYSTSVTTSVEVGASFLEIFSASVSMSVTFEQSVSYTETYTFDPSGRCKPEQSAILYFYPLFKQYQGFENDDQMNFIDVWIPIEGQNNFEMDVECLG